MTPTDPIPAAAPPAGTALQVLLLAAPGGAPVRLSVAGDGRVLARETLAAPAPAAAPPRRRPRLVVVVPGTEAPARWLALPTRSLAQARAAARELLRDELASDAGEALHIAVGETDRLAEPRPVVAVADARMRAWREAVESLGLSADAMVPDHLLLPHPAEGEPARVLAAGGDWLVRGAAQAFRVERALARRLLGAEAPAQDPADAAEAFEAAMALGALAPPLDLLQGAHGSVRPGGARGGAAWRRSAVLAGLLAASVPLSWGAEALRHRLAARALETRLAQRVAEALPAALAGTPAEAVAAADEALARARAGDTFPRAAAALFSALGSVAGAAVERIEWRAGGALRARIEHGAREDLDALGAAVAAHGLRLAPAGSRQADGRLHSDVDLEAPAP